ncbi:hypothetical protein V500_08184 [Pseudogymnoascus sp. VKM F-4518 (FW-2643)]|nr:hypothetical protein V500_08184 [Pseudogymnoascus sp. VKM F-4518 (FW-2643)]
MTNRTPNLQPTPLIPDRPKEVHSQTISHSHNKHKQRTRRHTKPFVEDSQIRRDEREGDQQFEEQQPALGEGVEDGEEPVDAYQAEGGDGGDVSGTKKGGLEEGEEEEGDAEVGEGERAVGRRCQGRR